MKNQTLILKKMSCSHTTCVSSTTPLFGIKCTSCRKLIASDAFTSEKFDGLRCYCDDRTNCFPVQFKVHTGQIYYHADCEKYFRDICGCDSVCVPRTNARDGIKCTSCNSAPLYGIYRRIECSNLLCRCIYVFNAIKVRSEGDDYYFHDCGKYLMKRHYESRTALIQERKLAKEAAKKALEETKVEDSLCTCRVRGKILRSDDPGFFKCSKCEKNFLISAYYEQEEKRAKKKAQRKKVRFAEDNQVRSYSKNHPGLLEGSTRVSMK